MRYRLVKALYTHLIQSLSLQNSLYFTASPEYERKPSKERSSRGVFVFFFSPHLHGKDCDYYWWLVNWLLKTNHRSCAPCCNHFLSRGHLSADTKLLLPAPGSSPLAYPILLLLLGLAAIVYPSRPSRLHLELCYRSVSPSFLFFFCAHVRSLGGTRGVLAFPALPQPCCSPAVLCRLNLLCRPIY